MRLQHRGDVSYDPVISAFSLPRPVITSKHLIVASVVLVAASALVAVLNLQKTRSLRTEVASSETARETAERQRASREKLLKDREAAVAAASAKYGDTQNKAATTEAELTKIVAEKNDLLAKLRANETEIADLRKRIETGESKPVTGVAPTTPGTDLQAQLEDAKKQLDA